MSNARKPAKTAGQVFDFDAFLAAPADLPERQVPMCLKPQLITERDLTAVEYDGLKVRYAEAVKNKSAMATDGAEVNKAKKAAEAAEAAVEAASVEFTIRAMPGPEYKTLRAKYPPREGNAQDRMVGFNGDDFFPVLLVECMVEPKLGDQARLDALLERMTEAQALRLFAAAYTVNEGEDGAVASFRGAASR